MKSTKISSQSSDEGHDTDTSDTKLTKNDTNAKWRDILVFFNAVPYQLAVFFCWYYCDHNVLLVVWGLYSFAPLLDVILPHDLQNLSQRTSKAFEKDSKFLIPLYVFLVLDFFIYFWAIYQFVFADFYSVMDRIIFVVSVAQVGSLNMVVGHELLHRRQLVHKIFGTLCYSKMLYSHFFIEHVKGHHKHVATPEDPATSRFGETLYEFFPRTFFGSYKSVWKYESARLQKKNISWFSAFVKNRLVLFNLAHAAWVGLLGCLLGLTAVVFCLTYAFIMIFMLETINYIEHYGLQRQKDENGIYEPVNIKHSWNAPHRYTNYVTFKLQRHSDHHANSYKPYQILNSYADSPTLLGGYSVAILAALVPFIWFRAYNPIVKAVNEERQLTEKEVKTCEWIIYRYIIVFGIIMSFLCLSKF